MGERGTGFPPTRSRSGVGGGPGTERGGGPGTEGGGGRASPVCCRWFGKCWYIHELLKYEFGIEFDVSGEETGGAGGTAGLGGGADPRVPLQIPVTYPATAPEIAIPELDGKTAKMYRL